MLCALDLDASCRDKSQNGVPLEYVGHSQGMVGSFKEYINILKKLPQVPGSRTRPGLNLRELKAPWTEGFRVEGLGFRFLGLRASGLGFGVYGFGFRV